VSSLVSRGFRHLRRASNSEEGRVSPGQYGTQGSRCCRPTRRPYAVAGLNVYGNGALNWALCDRGVLLQRRAKGVPAAGTAENRPLMRTIRLPAESSQVSCHPRAIRDCGTRLSSDTRRGNPRRSRRCTGLSRSLQARGHEARRRGGAYSTGVQQPHRGRAYFYGLWRRGVRRPGRLSASTIDRVS
jgi:hypothetical protein